MAGTLAPTISWRTSIERAPYQDGGLVFYHGWKQLWTGMATKQPQATSTNDTYASITTAEPATSISTHQGLSRARH